MTMRRAHAIPVILSLTVLALGLVIRAESSSDPKQLRAYHARVADALAALPHRWEGWVGRDVELPPSAQKLLRPNALFSRSYRDPETGRQCHVLVVHCRDTRDMVGHYPPVCYPAHGWKDRSGDPRSQRTDPTRHYRFERFARGRTEAILVRNFFCVPGAGRVPDMNSIRSIDEFRGRRVLGAAQVQMVFDDNASETERRETAETFDRMLDPALKIIGDWPPS